jgi:hypothetical protein
MIIFICLYFRRLHLQQQGKFSLEDVALLDLVFSLSVLYHDIMNLPERYAIVLLYAPMVIYIATRYGCYKTPDLTGL